MTRFDKDGIVGLYGRSRVGVLIHRDLTALYVNDAYAQMMGRDNAADFMRDPDLTQYIPTSFHHEAAALCNEFLAEMGFHGWKKVYNNRADGTPVWIEISDETIEWDDGAPALLTTAQAIENGTTAMQVDHMLGRSFIGVMVHRDMTALYVNNAFAQLMGMKDASTFMCNPDILRFIPEHNRARAQKHVADILNGARDGDRHRVCDILDDGRKVWRDLTDERILWHDGKPAILTTAHDVGDEVRMTEMLTRTKNSLENAVAEVIRMVPSAVAMLNDSMAVLHHNREFARLFSVPRDGGMPDDNPPFFDTTRLKAICSRMIKAGHDHIDCRGETTPSGRAADIHINRLEGGSLMVSAQDVTDHKRLEEQLNTLASTDPLTETLNRRGFESAVARLREIRRLKGKSWTFGLIVLDLDHFKNVNDRYGHACGDRMLQHVASTLRQALRDEDLVVRLGGEEFAVLLPSASERITRVIADRLAEQVREIRLTPKDHPKEEVGITASFGVTVGGDDNQAANNVYTALEVADRALYEAKQTGRDKVVFFTP